ncbi:MAG: hypothetical protein ACRCSG_03020 [Cellulosilyticaceae bacterium]
MLFDSLFFPENKKKELKIRELDKQITDLFETYKQAWNNLCKELNPDMEIPVLTKTLKDSDIEDCLQEMEDATNTLENIIKNISEKIDVEKLIKENNYKLVWMPTKYMHDIMSYIPLGIGLIAGVVVGIFVYKKVKNRFEDMINKRKIEISTEKTLINKTMEDLMQTIQQQLDESKKYSIEEEKLDREIKKIDREIKKIEEFKKNESIVEKELIDKLENVDKTNIESLKSKIKYIYNKRKTNSALNVEVYETINEYIMETTKQCNEEKENILKKYINENHIDDEYIRNNPRLKKYQLKTNLIYEGAIETITKECKKIGDKFEKIENENERIENERIENEFKNNFCSGDKTVEKTLNEIIDEQLRIKYGEVPEFLFIKIQQNLDKEILKEEISNKKLMNSENFTINIEKNEETGKCSIVITNKNCNENGYIGHYIRSEKTDGNIINKESTERYLKSQCKRKIMKYYQTIKELENRKIKELEKNEQTKIKNMVESNQKKLVELNRQKKLVELNKQKKDLENTRTNIDDKNRENRLKYDDNQKVINSKILEESELDVRLKQLKKGNNKIKISEVMEENEILINKESHWCTAKAYGYAFLDIVLITVIIDAILSYVSEWLLSISIGKRFEQISEIVSKLTEIMQKKICDITQLTQGLKDGIIWFDKGKMILIDKDKESVKLIQVQNIL